MTFEVEDSLCFEMSGRHVTRYLNNRLTQDIVRLPVGGSPVRAAALNAQGKLEALITIFRIEQDRYLIASEAGAGAAAEFERMILRFKVADDVQFKARPDLTLVHSNQAAVLAFGIRIGDSTAGFSWPRQRGVRGGKDLFLSREVFEQQIQGAQGVSLLDPAECMRLRIILGEPKFGADFGPDVLLPEVGFTDAVSFTKGCYVGQEVVARIDALGKPPRVIRRFLLKHQKSEPLLGGHPVLLIDPNGGRAREVGEILASIYDADLGAIIGFALVRNDERSVLAAGAIVLPEGLQEHERVGSPAEGMMLWRLEEQIVGVA